MTRNGKILRYVGIALIVTGIAVIAGPLCTNFVMNGRESNALNARGNQIDLITAQTNAGEAPSGIEAQVTEQPAIKSNTQSTAKQTAETLTEKSTQKPTTTIKQTAKTLAAKSTQKPTTKAPLFKISIPKINSNWIVYEGTDTTTLKSGPGHYIGTAMPGQVGPCVIAGHRTTYGAPFNKIDQLIAGDRIILETMNNKKYVYLVTVKLEVLPTDLSSIVMTDYPSVILTTCTPKYSAKQRLLVFAKLAE
jgi:LPXTG-site transpeptidase (sortase) family protein